MHSLSDMIEHLQKNQNMTGKAFARAYGISSGRGMFKKYKDGDAIPTPKALEVMLGFCDSQKQRKQLQKLWERVKNENPKTKKSKAIRRNQRTKTLNMFSFSGFLNPTTSPPVMRIDIQDKKNKKRILTISSDCLNKATTKKLIKIAKENSLLPYAIVDTILYLIEEKELLLANPSIPAKECWFSDYSNLDQLEESDPIPIEIKSVPCSLVPKHMLNQLLDVLTSNKKENESDRKEMVRFVENLIQEIQLFPQLKSDIISYLSDIMKSYPILK